MPENPTGHQRCLVLEIELPGVYTADLDAAVEQSHEFIPGQSDSDALLEVLRVSPQVGIRMMIEGEKDAEMVQIRGTIRKAILDA